MKFFSLPRILGKKNETRNPERVDGSGLIKFPNQPQEIVNFAILPGKRKEKKDFHKIR
jgi:hypothetical protein